MAIQPALPVSIVLKWTGSIAAIMAPVMLFIGPSVGLVSDTELSTVVTLLVVLAVVAFGLAAILDWLSLAVVELRELNALLSRNQSPRPDKQKPSTQDATAAR